MSVLIKGMDMPSSCFDCDLQRCGLWQRCGDGDIKRHKDCPLVEVKTPLKQWFEHINAQPEQRWIPCSERLPEEIGFYLTTTKDKAVYCDFWNEDNFNRTEMVIAWMPLPQPYKGKEE